MIPTIDDEELPTTAATLGACLAVSALVGAVWWIIQLDPPRCTTTFAHLAQALG